jgi:hypothetical protein
LKITFDFKRQPGNPRETAIHATFTNLTSSTFTDFVFQAAVPKVTSYRCILCLSCPLTLHSMVELSTGTTNDPSYSMVFVQRTLVFIYW